MKRTTIASVALALLVVDLLGPTPVPMAQNPTPGSGMPSWPLPDRPVPYHEPGYPAKPGGYSTQVTRVNAQGTEETVTLTGLDALLADGVIDDPLQGNYRLADLDKILVREGDTIESWHAISDTVSAPIEAIPGSQRTQSGQVDVAAGDLNGDGQDEQISAWVDSGTNHLMLTLHEMPGSFGKVTSAPAAVAHADGTMDLLVRGYDQSLWHRHYDGAAWGNWDNAAGGLLLSGPAVASRADGSFDVFAIGVDNLVYRRHWDGGGWSTLWQMADDASYWLQASGMPAHGLPMPDEVDAPGVVARDSGQLDLFRLGPDNTLRWRHSADDGSSWADWQNLGGLIGSAPAAVCRDGNDLQVFARGVDGALWHRTYSAGSWSGWARLEMPAGIGAASPPTAVSLPGSDRIQVYVRGSSRGLWGIETDGAGWGSWHLVGAGKSTAGSVGRALTLDGGDDYVMRKPLETQDVEFPMSELTAAFWMRSSDTTNPGTPLSYAVTGQANEFVVYDYNSLSIYVKGQSVATGVSVTDGAWHHIAVTWRSADGAVRLYKDGLEAFSSMLGAGVYLRPGGSLILGQEQDSVGGGFEANEAFAGAIDEVAVFDRALDAGEISALYGSGWDGMSSMLLGLHMDETEATHGTTLVDVSDLGNHGTLYTGPRLASRAGAVARDDGVELFALGYHGGLVRNAFDGAVWADWGDWGGLPPYYPTKDTGIASPLYTDVTTGHFTGDGRAQIALAYVSSTNVHLRIFDVVDGFRLEQRAQSTLPKLAGSLGWDSVRIAAGDFDAGLTDGDGLDEIAVLAGAIDWIGIILPSLQDRYVVQLFDVTTGGGTWAISQEGQYLKRIVPGTNWHRTFTSMDLATGNFDGSTDGNEEIFVSALDQVVARREYFPHLYEYYTSLSYYRTILDLPTLAEPEVKFHDQGLRDVSGEYLDHIVPELGGVQVAAGNLDGDSTNGDEIVEFYGTTDQGSTTMLLDRELGVWHVDAGDPWTLEAPGSPMNMCTTLCWVSPFTDRSAALVVGDVNQDLQDEIAVLYAYNLSGFPRKTLGVYSYACPGAGCALTHEGSVGTDTSLDAYRGLAAGSFTGESLRVGRPTYRVQNRVDSALARLNMPPKHWDMIKQPDGSYETIQILTEECWSSPTDPGCTHTLHGTIQGDESRTEIGTQRDWATASGEEWKFSNGTLVEGSLENSYGGNFLRTEEEIHSTTFAEQTTAGHDDAIIYYGTPYKIWEYPLFVDGTPEPARYITVMFPDVTQSKMPDAKAGAVCQEGWYAPRHQPYNVWSYDPVGDVRFPDYDPDNGILETIYEGTATEFKVYFEDISGVKTTSSQYHGVSRDRGTGFEVSGSVTAGVNLGFASASVTTNFENRYKAYTKSAYNWQEHVTDETRASGETFFSAYSAFTGPADHFQARALAYWSTAGPLVIDFQTTPGSGTTWQKYDKPDPAFILPWYGYPAEDPAELPFEDPNNLGAPPCGPEKQHFSHDVVIDPAFASVGDTVTISATVRNFSDEPADNVVVRFYQGDPADNQVIGQATIAHLERVNGPETASIHWAVTGAGEQKIYAVIDPDDVLDEMHDEGHVINNNTAYGLLQIGAASYFDMGVAEEQPYDAIHYDQGGTLALTLYVPPASLEATTRLDLHDAGEGSLSVVGNPFEIVATQGSDTRGWGDPIQGFSLRPGADDPPAVMGMSYTEAALGGRDEASLRLFRCLATDAAGWCTGGWEEAHLTCGVEAGQPLYPMHHYAADDLLFVPVCKTGLFALSDEAPSEDQYRVYLPLVMRNAP